jgi:hypothetical protein
MVFVHAVFHDEPAAAKAVQELVNAKFSGHDISALMISPNSVQELELDHKTGMGVGAVLGGVFGAIGGALAVSGGLVLAGPVFLALEGMLAGGVMGTLAGTLGGLGFWKEGVDFPKSAFENGAALVGVNAHDERVAEASEALRRAGAKEISSTSKPEAQKRAEAGSHHPQRI